MRPHWIPIRKPAETVGQGARDAPALMKYNHMRRHIAAPLCLVLLACSCNRTVVRHFPPDRAVPGTMHVDILESGHPEKYRTFDITPATGTLAEYRESADLADNKTVSFSTGALVGCEDMPSAESLKGTYLARCEEDHPLTYSIDILVDQTRTNTVVWSRSFDPGWFISGFGWNPTSPILAILVKSSVPQSGGLAVILGLLGHPPPDETVHLIVVSADTRAERDYIVVKHAVYGNPRLLGWSSSPR